MTSASQWRCRVLLGVVLLDLVLGSPVVKRQVSELLLKDIIPPSVDGAAQQAQLTEDTFGPDLKERSEREKRLVKLKTLGIGALGLQVAKAVGAKAVAAGTAAIKAKVVKAGAAAKALAVGAGVGLKAKALTVGTVGLKAKAIGAKALTALVALGIKTFVFKLLFGKINQLIDYKERLLTDLEHMNRVQNEAFNTNFYAIPKTFNPPPLKSAMRKANRSEKHYDNYSAGKSKNGGGDWAYSADSNHYSGNAFEDHNNHNAGFGYNGEPNFLPPAKELNYTSAVASGSDYEDADNASSACPSSEKYINNSVLNVLLWRRHGALRWPLHRDNQQNLESKNMTASDEKWSTEAVFGDDDYEDPKTPNNSLEVFNNNTNNTTDISSNDIPVRNYKLKRQKSFHNLKQFRKFYARDPTRDRSIELDKAFTEFKNDPQNSVLDEYRLSKLFANKAYRHPFDYYVPKRISRNSRFQLRPKRKKSIKMYFRIGCFRAEILIRR